MLSDRSTAQPLRVFSFEQDEPARHGVDLLTVRTAGGTHRINGPANPSRETTEPDRCDTVWYRLVTAISSTYVYVLVHTAPEACRFEIGRSGLARCYLSGDMQWELELPHAAYDQFELVISLWRDGAVDSCLQVSSLKLGVVERLASGCLSVAVMPAADPNRRTQTVAPPQRRW